MSTDKNLEPTICPSCKGTEFKKLKVDQAGGYYKNIYYSHYYCMNLNCNMMLDGWGLNWKKGRK